MKTKMKTIYIVNYKEKFIDCDGVLNTEFGTCEEGFKNEKDAIKKVRELADERYEECIEDSAFKDNVSMVNELGDDANGDGRDWDYLCIKSGEDTYEYYVYGVLV